MSDLILKDVSFSYPGGFLAVDHINMEIKSGENVAIVGQNGAGKTTTVKMMNGLLKPTEGDVLIGDMNTKNYTTAQVSRVVGYVFQNPDDQIFHATVESEVRYGPKTMKLDPAEEDRRVQEAAVIAMGTEILIFDEPTAGQDVEGNKKLSEILKVLHGQGKTVITISHDMEFVATNFDKVIVMAKKKVVRSGTPKEIFWDFESLEHAMLKQPYVSRVCKALNIGGNVISIADAVEGIMSQC